MWSAYIKPDLIERFQKEHNCCVVIDTYDSNEAMYTKLKLGGAGYDIVFPSNYFLDLMGKQGMLAEINNKDIPNSVYIDWAFLQKLNITENHNGLPYMVSFSGIA
jgi:spermidine/putrescine transport system substrate-binding protein